MNQNELINRDGVFGWIAAVTALLLLVPFVAMQATNEVSWGLLDFCVMAVLLFGTGSVCVLVGRKISRKNRLLFAMSAAIVILYVWAELAVGIFFTLGS